MMSIKSVLNKVYLYSIRTNFILMIVRIFGSLGIDLFHLTERLINRRFEKFFLKFLTNETKPVLIVNMLFTSEAKKIKKILIHQFGKGRLSNDLINFLVELYLSRVEGRPFRGNFYSSADLLRELEINCFRTDEYFLISKFFSKLGRFLLASEIESIVINSTYSQEFKSIYELYQFLKIRLYDDPKKLKMYLEELKLVNHFNKYYSYDFFLNKLLDIKKSSISKKITILGPLRGDLTNYKLKNKPFILIKPNLSELEFIKTNQTKNIYLYSHTPIKEFSNNSQGIINVFDNDKNFRHKSLNEIKFINLFLLINGYPQHLQRSLLHQILQTENIHFSLEFFNFYMADKIYSEKYIYPEIPISKMTLFESHKFVWGNGWHSFLSNFRFIRFLEKQGFITSDSVLIRKIFKLTLNEYALEMEDLLRF